MSYVKKEKKNIHAKRHERKKCLPKSMKKGKRKKERYHILSNKRHLSKREKERKK
jgi:hypothetical protein